jgi:hypothetical protein
VSGKAAEKLWKSCGNIATRWIGNRRYEWRLEIGNSNHNDPDNPDNPGA